ncbi:MAG: hypothetical protein ABIN01_06420 [Ferruginibacter sp.]
MQTSDKRKKNWTIKIIGIFILSIGLLWLVRLVFWENNPPVLSVTNSAPADTPENNIIPSQQRELLMQDEILHAHLNALQKLDQTYTVMLTDTTNKNGLMEINAQIASAEELFRQSIESVSKNMPTYPNREDENLFLNMIASFRLALDNRQSISNLRNAIGNNKAVLNSDQKAMLKIKNDILAKDTRIAALENEMKVMQKNIENSTQANADKAEEDKNSLVEKIVEKDNKIASLTGKSNLLQKEYDRLSRQVSEVGKNLETKESSFKTRSTSLESRIDELTAELRLAQVDCNLSRADASQIISNSKQRRVLLSEALAILNSLPKSDNAAIQKKVQDKITRLNQIASTSRD